jgi:hypothetical protein
MQIKTTLRLHHPSQNGYHQQKATNAGEDLREKEPSHTVEGNVN